MAKAFTPEVASGNTSSPVKTGFKSLSSPMAKAQGPGGVKMAVQGPSVRSVGMVKNLAGQGNTFQQHEMRSGGVPHMSMRPIVSAVPKVGM